MNRPLFYLDLCDNIRIIYRFMQSLEASDHWTQAYVWGWMEGFDQGMGGTLTPPHWKFTGLAMVAWRNGCGRGARIREYGEY